MIKKLWKSRSKDFDISFYQELYQDVRKFNLKLKLFSIWHWKSHGITEGRLHSKKRLTFGVRLKPSVGSELFFPKALLNYKFIDSFRLKAKPDRALGALVVLVPDLQANLFFAGYRSFFSDIGSVQDIFEKIYVVVFNPHFDPTLVSNIKNLTVLTKTEFELEPFEPDMFITFDAKTTLYSIENLKMASKTIYYCQDFEAGFHPFGSLHIWSLRALALSKHLIISTEELLTDLRQRDAIATDSVCVVNPKIEIFPIEEIPEKVIFAYFRPESFNSRNVAEHIWHAILEFCSSETGWKIYCVGTQGTNFEFEQNGNHIFVTEKLPEQFYKKVLGSTYLVLSFIYSSHPGVLAYQTAYSGIKTITNTFGSRTDASLKLKSPAIIPIDLVREDLARKLREEVRDFGARNQQIPPQSDSSELQKFLLGVNENANL